MESRVPIARPMTASSSIYSQDDVTLTDATPLITVSRQNSSSSSTSNSSTLYSLDPVKSLGYTPFEYWKGPLPVAYPGQAQTKNRRTIRAPPQIKTSTIPKGLVNSRRDFKPVPAAKVREIKMHLNDTPNAPAPAPAAPALPPPSPRVKDRYRQREAERARRREALRAQRARGPHDWPGWVPDEKAVRGARPPRPARRQGAAKRLSIASTIIFPPLREKWSDPRTWQRRAWGIVALVVVLVVIAAIILGQLMSKDNVLSMPQQPKRMLHQAGDAAGTADSLASTSSSSSSSLAGAPIRRVVARRFDG